MGVTEKELNVLVSLNVKRLRKASKMTQEELSAKADLKHIANIEGARNSLNLSTIVKLANALGVEPYELLLPGTKNEMSPTAIKSTIIDLVEQLTDLADA